MASRTWDPKTSLTGSGSDIYGRAGAPIYSRYTGGQYLRSDDPVFPWNPGDAIEGDPRYFRAAAPDTSSENSSNRRYWEPTDLWRQNSQWGDGTEALQIGTSTDNLIDPNVARWNDELGWQTPAWNIKGYKNSGMDNFLDAAMWAVVGGGLGGAALSHAGLLGGVGGYTVPEGLLAPMEPLAPTSIGGLGEGLGTGAGVGAATGGAGGYTVPEGLLSPMNPITPTTVGNLAGTSPWSLLMRGDVGGALTGAGQWAMNNPLQALGAAQMAGGLLGRATNRGTTGGSSGGSTKGGTGNGPKVSRGTWSPNPVTARQIANFRFTGG